MSRFGTPMNDDTIDIDSLVSETRRLCRRYIDEIVLAHDLCPWAAPALRAGSVQMSVITDKLSPSQDLSRAAELVRHSLRQCEDTRVELVLILLPRCEFSRLEMDDLLREVRQDGVSGSERRGEITFALAAFHPDAPPDVGTPERFIPYLRRSPDPMIQAVRTSVLEKIDPARGSGTAYIDLETMSAEMLAAPSPEPLRARIARTNLETSRRIGLKRLDEQIGSILEDRERTRARLVGRKV